MLRVLRFALFAGVAGAALAIHADAIRGALAAVASPDTHRPAPLAAPLALLLLESVYGTWLAGATLARWRMPAVAHLAPLAVLLVSVRCGPLQGRLAPPPSSVERAARGAR